MRQHPVSKAEFARMAGVTRMAISQACKASLKAACLGDRIDAAHPDAARYLASKGVRAPLAPTETAPEPAPHSTVPTAPRRKAELVQPSEREHEPHQQATAEDIEAYAHLSLTALTKRFGTATAFKDWLAAHKAIEDIREKRLKNDELEGRLIPRETVRQHVFAMISAANTRLLRDVPKTVAGQLYSWARADKSLEEAEAFVRRKIAEIIDPVKGNAARVLRNAGKAAEKKSDAGDD